MAVKVPALWVALWLSFSPQPAFLSRQWLSIAIWGWSRKIRRRRRVVEPRVFGAQRRDPCKKYKIDCSELVPLFEHVLALGGMYDVSLDEVFVDIMRYWDAHM